MGVGADEAAFGNAAANGSRYGFDLAVLVDPPGLNDPISSTTCSFLLLLVPLSRIRWHLTQLRHRTRDCIAVLRHPERWSSLKFARSTRPFYSAIPGLTNPQQQHEGRNILGYPALGTLKLNGEPVGWGHGTFGNVPLLQIKTDIETNLPALIDRYKPSSIIDFGTCRGGSALFFASLAPEASVVSIDIEDQREGLTHPAIQFMIGDALAPSTIASVRSAIRHPALLSFDDHHTHDHTLAELRAYAPLLRPGDVILMQDTWDQGLNGWPFSPLTAVGQFLAENDAWELDIECLRGVRLPCNFIHGVIRPTGHRLAY